MRIHLPKMIDPESRPKVSIFAKREELGEAFPEWYKTQVSEPVMAEVDAYPKEVRLLIHEYGWKRVKRWLSEGSVSEIIRALNKAKAQELDLDI